MDTNMKNEDKQIEGLLSKLGSLDQSIQSIGKEHVEFSPKALSAFEKEASKMLKALPNAAKADPHSQMDALHMAVNSAVEAQVIPQQFACAPIQSDEDLRYFTAKLSALNKDRGMARDFKEFLESFPEQSAEQDVPAEPSPETESPNRLDRLVELEMKRSV